MSILSNNPQGQSTASVADSLSGTPNPSFWSKWFGGCIVPAIIVYFGVGACVTQKAFLLGRNNALNLTGNRAIAMGIALLGVAFFMHFHFFWSSLKKLYLFGDPGKVLSAFVFICSLGYVIWKIASG